MMTGRLFLGTDGARFESEASSITFPLKSLHVHAGGHNNEQLFLEHPAFPGWAIVSSDPQLVHDPLLWGRPEFAAHLRKVQKSRNRVPLPVVLGLALLAFFLGLVLLLVWQKDRIVNLVVDRIPVSWEETLGDQVFQQIAAEGKIVEDSEWEPAVAEITARLLPLVSQSGYNFRFHIMQDTNVNAFAIPGGNVVILTGLLEAADSAEEVAGVVAHEIAHVTERHSLRQMLQSAGLWVIVTALFGDTTGIAAVVTEGSQFLLRQGFSRDFEREADERGWDYLLAAKIDPRGLTAFFEELKEIQGEAGMDSFAFLNTHPATGERIEHLERRWAELPDKRGFVPFQHWPEAE